MSRTLIEVDHLTVCYGSICALQEASVTICEGDFVGIIGPNGGGKSTFVKALMGLVPAEKGAVRYFDNQKEVPSIPIGYLPQHAEVDRQFPISVEEVIHSGLSCLSAPRVRFRTTDRQKVRLMADRMGLKGLECRPIAALSGGQLQRVLIGRALIANPRLLILDEPTSYLDQGFEQQLFDILIEANQQTTILMVSHNIRSVQSIARSLACINRTLHYHSSTDISAACLYETFYR